MPTPEERNLVRRCLAGDEEGWREFVVRFSPWIRGVALHTLRSYAVFAQETDLEEIGARTFETLLENDCRVLRRFRWDCSLKHWIALLARTQAVHWLRSRSSAGSIPLSPDVALDLEDPLRILSRRERSGKILDAFSRLSDRDRTLLEEIYVRRRSYRTLASEWKTSIGTLASWVARAKTGLLKLLDDLHLPLL